MARARGCLKASPHAASLLQPEPQDIVLRVTLTSATQHRSDPQDKKARRHPAVNAQFLSSQGVHHVPRSQSRVSMRKALMVVRG